MTRNSEPEINQIISNVCNILNHSNDNVLDYSDDHISDDNNDTDDIIENHAVIHIITMLDLISKEIYNLNKNPGPGINEISNEYDIIIKDFGDIIKQDPILLSLSDRIKCDMDTYKSLYPITLLQELSNKEKKNIYFSQQLELHKHMYEKRKRSIPTAKNIWDEDQTSECIGLELQYLFDKLKYITSNVSTADNPITVNQIRDQYSEIKSAYNNLISDDLCLTILSCDIESRITKYFKNI